MSPTSHVYLRRRAFDGLERKIIEPRQKKGAIGFGADIEPRLGKSIGEDLRQVVPGRSA